MRPKFSRRRPACTTVFHETFTGEIASAAQLAERLRDVIAEIRRPTSYDLRVGRLTDVGHVRQLNEDSLLTLELGRVHRSVGTPIGLYVVADGMGGHSAGDVASGLAIQCARPTRRRHAAAVRSRRSASTSPEVEAGCGKPINVANATVHEQRKLAGTNMGTTLVMAYVADGQAHVAHVGDSRAYVINDAGIQQITVDHSLVQRLVDTKQLTAEEARLHPQRNVIYKNLGDRAAVSPDITRLDLQPGDRLLLCSDGLNSVVEDRADSSDCDGRGLPAGCLPPTRRRGQRRGRPRQHHGHYRADGAARMIPWRGRWMPARAATPRLNPALVIARPAAWPFPRSAPISSACPECTRDQSARRRFLRDVRRSLAALPYLIVMNTGLRLPLFSGRSNAQRRRRARSDALSGVTPDLDLEPYAGELAGLSRRHARLILRDGQCWIEDLNSVNWTYLNNQRLSPEQPAPLKDGDLLRLGNVLLTYRAG